VASDVGAFRIYWWCRGAERSFFGGSRPLPCRRPRVFGRLRGRDRSVYQWYVFADQVGLVLFLIARGASTFISFRIRRLRDAALIVWLIVMRPT